MNLKLFRDACNARAEGYFAELEALPQATTSNQRVTDILGHAKHLFFAGGKRIRPYLVDLSFKSFGGTEQEVPHLAGFGVELLHLFALMQDDVMDRSDLRHGIPSLHVWAAQMGATRAAESQAILVGDLYCAWAHRYLNKACDKVSAAAAAEARNVFSTTLEELIVGQMLDIDATTQPSLALPQIMEKTRLKTSRYTFVGPIRLGATLAGSSATEFAETFGTPLGMAFQVQDDLLDITTSPDRQEKSGQLDITEHQHTYFTHFLESEAASTYRERWRKIKNCPSVPEWHILYDLFTASGAVAAGEAFIAEQLTEVRSALKSSPLVGNSEWELLIESIANRKH